MKNISSKRAKACAISHAVKKRVYERDEEKCIFCDNANGIGLPEAHYIPRSQGGLGIEENIFTACRICHDIYDQGSDPEEHEIMKEIIEDNFRKHYPNWDEVELVYKKNGGSF